MHIRKLHAVLLSVAVIIVSLSACQKSGKRTNNTADVSDSHVSQSGTESVSRPSSEVVIIQEDPIFVSVESPIDVSMPSTSDGSGTSPSVSTPEASVSSTTTVTSNPSTPTVTSKPSTPTVTSKPTTPSKPSTTSTTSKTNSVASSTTSESTSSKTVLSEPDPAYLFVWTDDYLTTAQHVKLQSKFLKLINTERASKGCKQLTEDPDLDRFSAYRGKEVQTLFSHTRPDGTEWATAIPTEYMFKTAGENLTCAKVGTLETAPLKITDSMLDEIAQRAFDSFKNSPSHYENLTLPEFTRIGICFNVVKKVENNVIYYYYYCTNLFASYW